MSINGACIRSSSLNNPTACSQMLKVKGLKERNRPADKIEKEEKKLDRTLADFKVLQNHTRAKVCVLLFAFSKHCCRHAHAKVC